MAKVQAVAGQGESPRLKRAAKIHASLVDEVILDFNDAPLSEIVDYLQDVRQIPIVVDKQGLRMWGWLRMCLCRLELPVYPSGRH